MKFVSIYIRFQNQTGVQLSIRVIWLSPAGEQNVLARIMPYGY